MQFITRCLQPAGILLAAITILNTCGCSLPILPKDDDHEVFGGIVERAHPSLGRANSAFDLPVLESESSADDSPSSDSLHPLPAIRPQPLSVDPFNHSPIIP